MRHLIDSRQRPMLVPPRPWEGLCRGGLLRPAHTALRGYGSQDRGWLMQAEADGKFRRLLKGLTVLGATPWCVCMCVLLTRKCALVPPFLAYG